MKTKSEYNKQEYLDELVALWVDVCGKVYRRKWKEIDFAIDNILKHEAEQAWDGTNYTPLQYVLRYADPKNVTNQIGHGQKAREQRWDEWVKNIQSPKPEWMTPQLQALSIHNDSCLKCRKAIRGRFAGATTKQINNARCDEGRLMAEKAFAYSEHFAMERSYHLAEIASKVVEDEFGEKELPAGFKNGLDYLDKDGTLEKPIRWTKIKCSQCQSQVYFDLVQFRHRCHKCGYGF